MGAQCKNITELTNSKQYSVIQSIDHLAFGEIFYLKSQKDHTQKGVKKIQGMQQAKLDSLKKRIQFAKQCDNSISTLVQIYNYDIVDNNGRYSHGLSQQQLSNFQTYNCGSKKQTFLLVHFHYYPQNLTLKNILKDKERELMKTLNKYGKNLLCQINHIKMCNYEQIDKLQSHQRQLINIYYQQIEVVRMIDHIIGAVYFLHHFDVPHQAIRPDNILVDDQGRYILVDRQIFQRKTNYELALEYLQNTQMGRTINEGDQDYQLQYLSPQSVTDLRSKTAVSMCSSQKSDIFCVGILALNICLLQKKQNLFSYNNSLKTIQFNQIEMDKQLRRIHERYSDEFVNLLSKMMKKDPTARIDFVQLIDQLNPLLIKNLDSIKRIHSFQTHRQNTVTPQLIVSSQSSDNKQQIQDLKTKLKSIEHNFQKVMNNRTVLFNRDINQKQLIEEQGKILKKLATIKTTRSAFSTSTRENKKGINPQLKSHPVVASFSPALNKQTVSRFYHPPPDAKRYISGKQLQQIVWKEYQNLKSRRNTQK